MTALEKLVEAAEKLLDYLDIYRVPTCERERADLRDIIITAKSELAEMKIENERQQGIDDTAKELGLESWQALQALQAAGITRPEELKKLFEAIAKLRANMVPSPERTIAMLEMFDAFDDLRLEK